LQTKLTIQLHVEVDFDVLDPLDEHDIPLQLDITGVYINIPSSQGKSRRVNILPALSESEVLALEDEILNPEFVADYFRYQAWRSRHE
jgi:hypothetical protein